MIEVFNINSSLTLGILNLSEFASSQKIENKRDLESKGKEELIKQLVSKDAVVNYDTNGKPFLVNDTRHISISHSHDKLAILLNNDESTGVDIELIRDKVLRIKHKFLTDKELLEANNDVEKLIIYWACKETLYKIHGRKEVNFIENLFVKPFLKDNLGTIIGEINMPHYNYQYKLNYQKIEDYVLVYALNKL